MNWLQAIRHACHIPRRPKRPRPSQSVEQRLRGNEAIESRDDGDGDEQETKPAIRLSSVEPHCYSCGYDLRGIDHTGNCPECGMSIALATRPPQRFRYGWEVKIVLIAAGALIVVVEGPFLHLFLIWNLLPIILALVFIHLAEERLPLSPQAFFALFVSIAFAVGVTVFFHLAWMIDIAGTATGSSTSALMFVFLPVYSAIAGVIGGVIGVLIGSLQERFR